MTFTKFKAWVRLVVTILLLLAVVLVVWKNWDNQAKLWFFGTYDVGVILLLIVTAVVTLVGYWILKGVYGAYRDVKRPEEAVKG